MRAFGLLAAVFLTVATLALVGCEAHQPGMKGASPSGYPPEPPESGGLVQPGARLLVRLDQPIGPDRSKIGQRIHAHVAQPLVGSDGRVQIPGGAIVEGYVADLRPSTGNQPPQVSLAFDQLRLAGASYPIKGHIVGINVEAARRGTRPEYLGGAAEGAVLGGFFGLYWGALAGTMIGAGAATAVSLGRVQEGGQLPAGTAIGIELEAPIDLSGYTTPQSPYPQAPYRPY
jgi:hypothetical protein